MRKNLIRSFLAVWMSSALASAAFAYSPEAEIKGAIFRREVKQFGMRNVGFGDWSVTVSESRHRTNRFSATKLDRRGTTTQNLVVNGSFKVRGKKVRVHVGKIAAVY